ncbi:MAG: class I SAM-dependent methyltransferase [Steroidobacteraceae bacterium]
MSSTPQVLKIGAFTIAALLLSWEGVPAQAATSPGVNQALEAAVHGSWRTPKNVLRDKYRHPVQTLEFFGIRPDMRVVEVLPGGGWYTEILAPFLRGHGQLIEASSPLAGTTGFGHESAVRFRHKLASDPAVYGKVRLEPFVLPDYMYLGAPDSADMVVTFRNMHDMMYENVHGMSTDLILQTFLHSAYQVLKPGGVLGIEAHRANPDMPLQQDFKLARVPEPFLIREAEQAGFKLAGTSQINANPKDPRTMPVFFFPPSLSPKSGNVAHYATLGEADNMELRFVKPGT